MSKQNIPLDRRYSIWLAHHGRCWFCREPVAFSDTHVDHVIPEALHDSAELLGYLEDLGLPGDFDLFSDENLAPGHARCNLLKSGDKFKATPLIQKIIHDNLEKKAPKVAEIKEKIRSDKTLARSAATVLAAIDQGTLNKGMGRELRDSLDVFLNFSQEFGNSDEPLFLTPWLRLVSDQGSVVVLRGPSGLLGRRPKGNDLHPSWDCPNCGPTGWNGARCIICGHLNDD